MIEDEWEVPKVRPFIGNRVGDRGVDMVYNLTTRDEDHIHLSTSGESSWQSASPASGDSEAMLERWLHAGYELMGQQCARVTRGTTVSAKIGCWST